MSSVWSNDGWNRSAGNLVGKHNFSSITSFIFRVPEFNSGTNRQISVVVRWLVSHWAESNG